MPEVVKMQSPFALLTLGEDVRIEEGRKYSMIGVPMGPYDAPEYPITFPKFVLNVQYFERPNESDLPIEVRVYLPGEAEPVVVQQVDTKALRMQAPADDPEADDPFLGVGAFIVLAPMVIKGPGRLRVRFYRGDLEIRAGSHLFRAPSGQN